MAGAFGAVVAALLSSFTEPVLNRVAMKRLTVAEALAEVRFVDSLRFFRTVLATNLLKFPFFEAVYAITSGMTGAPPSLRGIAAAVLYTTFMLPLSNYRYMKSLQMKVSLDMVYQAYWPTLLRDLVYGVARMKFLVVCTEVCPNCAKSLHIFAAIGVAMLLSSPFNELRAFFLQPRNSRLPPGEFFRITRFLRSALLGAFIPAIAIAVGQLFVLRAKTLLGCVHVGLVLWLAWSIGGWLFALGKSRQYYDPCVRPTLLKRFMAEQGRRAGRPRGASRLTPGSQEPKRSGLGATGSRCSGRGAAGRARLVAPKATGSASSDRSRGSGAGEEAAGSTSSDRSRGSAGEEAGQGREGGEDSERGEVSKGSLEGSEPQEAVVPTWKALLRFVTPAFFLVVANSSMSSVDKAFMGRTSTLELAAMGPATAAFDSSSYLLTFLNTATLSLLTNCQGDPEMSRRVRSHAVAIAASGAVLLAIVLWTEAHRFSTRLGATPEMLPYSVSYLRLRALGAPIERGASVATSFCLAEKDGTTPLLVTVLGLAVNVIGDAALVSRFGLQGVAIASVFASAVGYAYLIYSLRRRALWPEPFDVPRGQRDILPFLRFAGPVLFAVFLKTIVLANMTAAASTLGMASAAAHQIFSTLFLLTAVALGNPFSWAAQAFLPPLLQSERRRGGVGTSSGAGRSQSLETLARLLLSALVSALLGSLAVVVFCRAVGGVATSDPEVLAELAHASLALMPFTVLYPVLLTLEGALYGAQRRGAVLALSLAFYVLASGSLRLLRHFGMMTLSTIWISTGVACGVAVLLTAGLAVKAMQQPKKAPRPVTAA